MLSFHVLGPVEMHSDGRVVSVPGIEQRLLLGLLVLHANRPVPIRRMVRRLWGEHPPPGAQSAVRHELDSLEQSLGPDTDTGIRAQGASTYLLTVDPADVDLYRFMALRRRGHDAMVRGDARTAADLLSEAALFWRGPAVAEAVAADLHWPELAGLEELRLCGLEDRLEADLRLDRHEEVVGELELLARQHPLRGRLHGLLMVALSHCGRRAEAIAVYQRALRCAQEQGRRESGVYFNRLRQAVLKLDLEPPSAADVRPRWSTAGPTTASHRDSPASTAVPAAVLTRSDPRRLAPTSSNDGARSERDLLEVARHLNRSSPVTLVGAPGPGRTRLALATAAMMDGHFADGVTFVSLARATDAAEVMSAIAAALGLTKPGHEVITGTVTRHLAHREMLLILDDADQVPDTAHIVDDLLAASAGLAVLATGRQRLGVAGERVYPPGTA